MESVGVCATSGVELIMLIKSAINVDGRRGVWLLRLAHTKKG